MRRALAQEQAPETTNELGESVKDVAGEPRVFTELEEKEAYLQTLLGDEAKRARTSYCTCTEPKLRVETMRAWQLAVEGELARVVARRRELERREDTFDAVDQPSELCVATTIMGAHAQVDIRRMLEQDQTLDGPMCGTVAEATMDEVRHM